MRFSNSLSLLALSAAVLGSGLAFVASAGAQTVNDSTSITGASALGNSVCPNYTRSDFKFYRTPPAGSYRDPRDGDCYPTSSCPAGFDVAGGRCIPVAATGPSAALPAAPSGPSSAYVGYGAPPAVTFTLQATAQIGTNALANWTSTGNPLPTSVTIGCYGAAGSLIKQWSFNSGSGAGNLDITANMAGNNTCYAFNNNSVGNGVSLPQPLVVGCGANAFYSNGSCQVFAQGSCPANMGWNGATCVTLAACPAVLQPWDGSGPITSLNQANPTSLTPDGHEWCYYYGRGGNDGGDPWAAAFDRVVGKPVAFYPYYVERIIGYNQPSAYGHMQDNGGDGGGQSFVIDGYYPAEPIFGFDSTSFQGVIPVYGTGQVVDGGSKCAPGHSTGLSGYYQAWYPSDCSGHGDSGLSLYGPTQYPGDAACIYSLDPANPFRSQRGYTQAKIGLQGDMGGASFQSANGLVYSIAPRFAYPATHAGCKPGMVSLGTYDPYAPPTNSGGGGL